MQIHEVIARGSAAIRKRKGWTQERTAIAYRDCGLASWRTSTVGSLEAGMRRPRLDEVLLICLALGSTLAELVRAADADAVELGNGVVIAGTHISDYLIHRDHFSASFTVRPAPEDRAMPTESERHAARRLGIEPAAVQRTAKALWGMTFDEERDARIGSTARMGEPRSRQARRGLASRLMLAEMRTALGEDA